MTSVRKSALVGAASGLGGAAVMAAASNLEQRFTHRPDSYIPGHTLAHLLELRNADRDQWSRNMTMHYASGAIAGVIRGVMSCANLRGPFASLMHANIRVAFDQTLENLTGVGAPPWTQPRDELLIDLVEKGIYALTTGALADTMIAPLPNSSARRRGLSLRLSGRA